MTIGSLFSGIGGLELGLERAGLGPVLFQVEIDPFCRAVLAKHWPNVTRFEDVREVGPELPRVDLLCGGFPCQDVSSAGNRAGLSGAKSGLWREFRRVVETMRPAWVAVENVYSGKALWLAIVKADLEALRYRARAFELSAADVGAPHERRRVFVVAHADGISPRGAEGSSGPESLSHGDADREGQPARALDVEVAELQGVAGPASPWATPPFFRRVDDGLSGGVDRTRRIRALGNAVVPQCAEVIGRMIRSMLPIGGDK